jgi:hypothetical protein
LAETSFPFRQDAFSNSDNHQNIGSQLELFVSKYRQIARTMNLDRDWIDRLKNISDTTQADNAVSYMRALAKDFGY